MKKIMIILAPGFEEAEAIITADVLRRLKYDVVLAGLMGRAVTGSHRITVQADAELASLEPANFQAVALPGGLPGATNLRDSAAVKTMVQAVYQQGGVAAAVCAAPIALGAFGLLDGRKVTCYPGFEKELGNIQYTGALAEIDGRIVTGKGPGATFHFAAAVAKALGTSDAEIKTLFAGMFVQ